MSGQNHWELVQCTHPGCIYVAAAVDNPTKCIFHGEVEFTNEITSEWVLSKRKHMYRAIPNGHMTIHRNALTDGFGGVIVSINGESVLVPDRHNVETLIPESYWFYVDEVFNVVYGNFNKHKSKKTKYVDTPAIIACRVCGYTDERLDKHLHQQHHMSVDEYRKLHYRAPVVSDKLIERYQEYKERKRNVTRQI